MRVSEFEFRPSLLPTLVVMILLPLLASLGFWQLSRAEQKRELIDLFEARAAAVPLAASDLADRPIDDLRYRKVLLTGEFDAAHQFLLDNQVRNGRAGFEVLSPLRLTDGRQVLVNRGWVPLGSTRAQLPEVTAPSGTVSVSGWIYAPHGDAYSLGAMDAGEQRWPRVVQYLDFAAMGDRLDATLLPLTVRLDADDTAGDLVRDWPVVPFTPAKHIAYAVQWFGLACTLLVIYLVVNVKRKVAHD